MLSISDALTSSPLQKPFVFDFTPVIHFVVFTILSTPPNFLWQLQLESWYPSQVPVEQKTEKENTVVKTKLSKFNTIKKFATDQLLGAPINTVLFLAFMGYMRGFTGDALKTYVSEVSSQASWVTRSVEPSEAFF
jgi:protein Mpv17